MVVGRKYKRVTHKVSKELADFVLRSLKDSGGRADWMTVFVVYTHKEDNKVLLTTWDALSNEEVLSKGLVSLLDTSGVNRLVASNQSMQYKTNLSEYLYKVLKREEKLYEDSKKRGRV